MIGSGIEMGWSSRYLLPPLIVLLLYMAMSMGISSLSVSDSFGAIALAMLLVIAVWLVMPAAIVIYIVWKISSRQWRSASSGLAAIGFIVGINPLLSIIDFEIRLARRMPDYLKTLAELPPAENTFHAFAWGGWAGGTDQFFIYTSNPSALLLGKPAPMGNVLQWSNNAQMEAVCAGRSLTLRPRFFYCNPFAGRSE
ncbi:MAG: hypothetical protein ACRYGI_02155 [Janthinobacterium lividum]